MNDLVDISSLFAPWLVEWTALLVRWFHFMMGVAWIGASFYFVWLNNSIRPPAPGETAREGVAGGLFAVHGGAFYEVSKYGGAPPRLPAVLHWFKWEAYLTWISGFILVLIHFWREPGQNMVDPAVAALSPAQALGIGVATLLGGWFFYDGVCRSPLKDHGKVLAAVLMAFILGVSYGLHSVLAARAATLHVGAMLGTWMAANVLFVIIPGQKAMVGAMVEGKPPPLERGKAGALRSLHNNYLTLPVLFVMISGHFPQVWGHSWGWLALAALGLVGASWRHYVNLHERGDHRPWIPVLALIGFFGLGWLLRPTPNLSTAAADAGLPPVSFVEVQQIIALRCLPCHASEPSFPGYAAPPKGLILEEPRAIRAAGAKIHQQVVVSKVMPLANLTAITEEERERIARWARQEGFAGGQ